MAKAKKKECEVNIFELYSKEIDKYPAMSVATINQCLQQYKNGTSNEKKIAKERLVGSLQKFVLSVANKYANNGNIMDIISEGNIGLMKALEEYDINSEVKFTTYAMYWIRKTIMSYITTEEPIVSPNNAIKLATYVPKIQKEFWDKHMRVPTIEEIQEQLKKKYNLNFSNKNDLLTYQPVSIDEKYDEDEDGQEFMESSAYTSRTSSCNTNEFEKNHDEKTIVKHMLSSLNDRDAYILKCIYGIDCEAKTMDDVADEIGITHERVRQIAVNSLEKLGKRFQNIKNEF